MGRVLRPGARLAIAEIDLPGPVRWSLRLLESPHAGWSRRELADFLYRSGFRRVRAMAQGPWAAGWPPWSPIAERRGPKGRSPPSALLPRLQPTRAGITRSTNPSRRPRPSPGQAITR